jgi:hypothetical protein
LLHDVRAAESQIRDGRGLTHGKARLEVLSRIRG